MDANLDAATQVFSRIYKQREWGGASPSGPGSDAELVHSYLRLIPEVIKEKHIRSVLDLGCGDWSLGKHIDWSGVDYVGVDIVPELVAALNRVYAAPNIRFVCANLNMTDLPTADLCIIKDVLQHLSNASVRKFLDGLPRYFKYAIITNDLLHHERSGWRNRWKTTRMVPNSDITGGGYRPVKLTESPFDLKARRLGLIPLRFRRHVLGYPGTVFETKEILFWDHAVDPAR
jgi:SAM-dependent methyltransferase